MVSPRRTSVPGSAIHASVPPTSLEMRASLRLTTVPVAVRLAAKFSERAVVTTTGTGGVSAALAPDGGERRECEQAESMSGS